MKRLLSILITVLMLLPSTSAFADGSSNDNIYNNIIEDGTSFGKDDIGIKETEVSPLINSAYNKNINNIVIIIRFKGELEFMNEEKSVKLNDTYNTLIDINNDNVSDLGSISLNSYINDLTYGQINVNSTFYPKSTEGNYFSIEAPETRDYYEKYQAGSSVENELLKWAFNEVKGNINLSSTDLDKDGDGNIDSVTFLVNGATVKNNMLWPHETQFTGSETLNNKRLSTYNLVNVGTEENSIFNKNILNVVIHEFLHTFNYPDLYRYYRLGNPVGQWDIMANSIGNGQLPLVYTRNFYGNLNINIGEITSDGVYTLKNSQSSNKNDKVAFKIKSPKSDSEYFMVEYRKNTGNWDNKLPGSGLIVYRINDNVNPWFGNRNGYPDHIYVYRPYESDNKYAAGDISNGFLSKESGRTSFGNSDLSEGFKQNSLFFDNGANSGIVISEVGSVSGDEITFKVTYPKENSEINFSSIIGIDRYDTAAKASSSNFKTSNTVVLVNGDGLADGLTVTPLASYLNAPILLVMSNGIPSQTLNEIRRLGASKIIISGGDGVVSQEVINQLNKIGISDVTRLGGLDRYETSFEILKYIDKYCYDVENIVVSNGFGEADALSISSAAGRDKMPIVLSETNKINDNIYNWLKGESLNTAYIIGGTGVLSNNIVSSVNAITVSDISGNRLGGLDRYETNAMVIGRFYGANLNKVYATKGYELVDALSSGPIAALNNGPVVLCDSDLNVAQKNILDLKNTSYIVQVGGGVSTKAIDTLKFILK